MMTCTRVAALLKTVQLAELPIFLVTPLLFVGVMYYMVGLNPIFTKFLTAIGIVEILTQVVVSFGRFIITNTYILSTDCCQAI